MSNAAPSPLVAPTTDPAALFGAFRANHGSEILVAAVTHWRLFERLSRQPLTPADLGQQLNLAMRPLTVMTTVLRALGFLQLDAQGRLEPTLLAREHLVAGSPFDTTDYLGLSVDQPGVRQIIERFTADTPQQAKATDHGLAFIFREGQASAMDESDSARRLTLALAGRAKSVAPALARVLPSGQGTLLDVGGGSGIYAIAALRQHPNLKAIILDRPEVLKVAEEFAREYGVADRVELLGGDMFTTAWPMADMVLLSNVLHDWDVPECEALIDRAAAATRPGGWTIIHDAFLNDTLDGPWEIAVYSVALYLITEGRAYSAAEYRSWLTHVGLTPETVQPTLGLCGMLAARKPV